MKEKLTNNLTIKLLSLFCAFFVWLAVVNVANPIVDGSQDVPVEFTNEGVLEKANLTYNVVGKSTATITYKIRTKDRYKVKASDFRAYVDLSEMYDVTGAIPIKVEVLKHSELLETAPVVKSPEVIKIETEELQTKPFTLQTKLEGKPADGYQTGKTTLSPSQVAVKGPVSLVGQISSVGIIVDLTDRTADVSSTAVPIYFDANGNKLNLGEEVKTLGGEVSYTVQILKVKEVPLDFVVTGEVADGYRLTGIEASQKNVSVAGLKSDLASVSKIEIQDPSLNIDGATDDIVCQIDVKDYVSQALTIAGMEDTVITVTLRVEPLRDKTFQLEPKDITLMGRDDNYSYTLGSEKVGVAVRGLKEDLDSLSAAKMNVQADVSGLEPGVHQVKASLQLDDAFEVITYPDVTVTVTERENQGETKESEEESGAQSQSAEEGSTAGDET